MNDANWFVSQSDCVDPAPGCALVEFTRSEGKATTEERTEGRLRSNNKLSIARCPFLNVLNLI